MVLKTDTDTLTKELKMAAKVGRNFLFSPSTKPEDSYLALSKKRIPASERKLAKKKSKKPAVYWGSCFKEKAKLIFETPLKVSPVLSIKLKNCIRIQTGYPAAKAEIRQNTGWVENEYEDEETPAKGETSETKASPKPTVETAIAKLEKEFEDARAKLLAVLTALTPLIPDEQHKAWTDRQTRILDYGQKLVAAQEVGNLPPLLESFQQMVDEAETLLTRVRQQHADYLGLAGELPKLKKGVVALAKAKHPDAAELAKLIKQSGALVKARRWGDAAQALAHVRHNIGVGLAAVKKKIEFDAALKKVAKVVKAGSDHDPGPFTLLKRLHKEYKAIYEAMRAARKKFDFTTALAELKKLVPRARRLIQIDKDYAAYATFRKANKAAYDYVETLNNSCPPNPIWKDMMNLYWGHLRKYWGSDFKAALVDLKKVVKGVPALKKKVAAYDKQATKKADKATTELKDLVKGKTFNFPNTTQGKKAEAKLVKTLSQKVSKLKPDKRLQLLTDMHGPTAKLTKEQRIMQRALYRQIKRDKGFVKADQKTRDGYRELMKKDKQLQDAVASWGKKKNGVPVMDLDKKKALIAKVMKTQCTSLKIPIIPLSWFQSTGPTNGAFNQNKGEITLNERVLADMTTATNVILHEVSHHYQDQLCKWYINGTIKEGDPRYKQAKAFAALHHMDAYVSGKEDYDCYQAQPEESHAWDVGNNESKKLVAGLRKERRRRLKEEAKKRKKKK